MTIRYIHYSRNFRKRWDTLSGETQHQSHKVIDLFRKNPFHPSLRLHRLQGNLRMFWSISIDRRNRIIFRVDGDTAYFWSIGTYTIYEKR